MLNKKKLLLRIVKIIYNVVSFFFFAASAMMPICLVFILLPIIDSSVKDNPQADIINCVFLLLGLAWSIIAGYKILKKYVYEALIRDNISAIIIILLLWFTAFPGASLHQFGWPIHVGFIIAGGIVLLCLLLAIILRRKIN